MNWTYDRYGNRLTQTTNGQPQTLSPDSYSNRLGSYSYDRNGNMVTDGAYGLTYDAADHLVQYGADVTYTYDGNDLRVRKNMGGAELVSVFSGGKVVAEYTYGADPSTPTSEYVHLGGALLASKQGSSYKFYLQDHLSVRAVVNDQTGEVKEQGHKPFGEPWYGNDTASKWKFTTYERDSDGMLSGDYAMARYDCNWLGRYLSPDPMHGSVGNPQSWNRYSYVLNDPANLMDPLGLNVWAVGANCYVNYNPSEGNIVDMVCVGGGGSAFPGEDPGGGGGPERPTWHPQNLNKKDACAAMAGKAEQLAKQYKDAASFAKAFGNATVGVGDRPGTRSYKLMHDILGNDNFAPVMYGVGPAIGSMPLQEALNYPGAFKAEFRDSLEPNQDQSHHFVAYLQMTVQIGANLALAGVGATDTFNQGDINLAKAAISLGIELTKGMPVANVADWIRLTICNLR